MKKLLEKVSILSLSLIITTSFSISSAIPAMLQYFKGYPISSIELLISLPSLGIMIMLFFNSWIESRLGERRMIVYGLMTITICGIIPLLSQFYPILFLSRLLFGLGLGLINSKAISIISERYQGLERTKLLGYRGSAEVVGIALLTLIVGLLLPLGWT